MNSVGRDELAEALRDLNTEFTIRRLTQVEMQECIHAVREQVEALRSAGRRDRDQVSFMAGVKGDHAMIGEVYQHFDECFVSGSANPISMMLRVVVGESSVIGNVTFPPTYEGAIGRAHGGAVAALFDDLLGYSVTIGASAPAYMVSLEIAFRAGVPIASELVCSSRVTKIDGRKVWVEGEVRHCGDVLASAKGLALVIEEDRFVPLVT